MKKKILILLLVVIIVVSLVGLIYFNQNKTPSFNEATGNEPTGDEEVIEEKDYTLTNNNYVIGKDIPSKIYTVKSIKDNPEIVIIKENKSEKLTLKKGDELDLTNQDIISVTNGELILS